MIRTILNSELMKKSVMMTERKIAVEKTDWNDGVETIAFIEGYEEGFLRALQIVKDLEKRKLE